MTDYDPRVAAILDALVPVPRDGGGDWDALVRCARAAPVRRTWAIGRGARGRQRRWALVLATAVVVIALTALPALADRSWWFLGPGGPAATTGVHEVASGRSAGIGWTMTAHVSEGRGVCVALTVDLGARDTGGESCGAGVRGEPNLNLSSASPRHWIGFGRFALGRFNFPDVVLGPAAGGVESVEVVLSSGETLRTTAIEGPPALDTPLNFYVIEVPPTVAVDAIVARDAAGTVLEQRRPARWTARFRPRSSAQAADGTTGTRVSRKSQRRR